MLTVNGSALKEYADYANLIFNGDGEPAEKLGLSASNGFIGYSSNLHSSIDPIISDLSIPYGFENVWYKRKKGLNLDRLDIIRDRRKKDTRIYLRDLNLISLEDIFELFDNTVYMQNQYGAVLENAAGKRITIQKGRYSLKPGSRQGYVQKRLKNELKPIKQVILLSLSIHQPEVERIMPDNTNLLPIEYAILHCWGWLNNFLKRLRRYVERRSLPWGYIGSVLQFQDDNDNNGFPHFHVPFSNRWLGSIEEIAELWPYSPRQGVDIMTKAKWEKKNPGKKYTPLRVANYLCKYLGKSAFYDKEKGIHKCHAIASFYGVRMFNLSHEYRAEKQVKQENNESWKYVGMKNA